MKLLPLLFQLKQKKYFFPTVTSSVGLLCLFFSFTLPVYKNAIHPSLLIYNKKDTRTLVSILEDRIQENPSIYKQSLCLISKTLPEVQLQKQEYTLCQLDINLSQAGIHEDFPLYLGALFPKCNAQASIEDYFKKNNYSFTQSILNQLNTSAFELLPNKDHPSFFLTRSAAYLVCLFYKSHILSDSILTELSKVYKDSDDSCNQKKIEQFYLSTILYANRLNTTELQAFIPYCYSMEDWVIVAHFLSQNPEALPLVYTTILLDEDFGAIASYIKKYPSEDVLSAIHYALNKNQGALHVLLSTQLPIFYPDGIPSSLIHFFDFLHKPFVSFCYEHLSLALNLRLLFLSIGIIGVSLAISALYNSYHSLPLFELYWPGWLWICLCVVLCGQYTLYCKIKVSDCSSVYEITNIDALKFVMQGMEDAQKKSDTLCKRVNLLESHLAGYVQEQKRLLDLNLDLGARIKVLESINLQEAYAISDCMNKIQSLQVAQVQKEEEPISLLLFDSQDSLKSFIDNNTLSIKITTTVDQFFGTHQEEYTLSGLPINYKGKLYVLVSSINTPFRKEVIKSNKILFINSSISKLNTVRSIPCFYFINETSDILAIPLEKEDADALNVTFLPLGVSIPSTIQYIINDTLQEASLVYSSILNSYSIEPQADLKSGSLLYNKAEGVFGIMRDSTVIHLESITPIYTIELGKKWNQTLLKECLKGR